MICSRLISREGAVLAIIDVQDKLIQRVVNKEVIIKNITKLVKFAKIIGMPIILTEQYPKGLGRTVDPIRKLIPSVRPIEKLSFNCFLSEEFRRKLEEIDTTTLILVGIEAHICVIQTALCGLDKFKIYVISDAISSRRKEDLTTAIERMRREGVTLASTEMLIYEMLKEAGTDEFKKALEIIKQ